MPLRSDGIVVFGSWMDPGCRGANLEGGNTSEFERFGVIGPLGEPTAGAPRVIPEDVPLVPPLVPEPAPPPDPED